MLGGYALFFCEDAKGLPDDGGRRAAQLFAESDYQFVILWRGFQSHLFRPLHGVHSTTAYNACQELYGPIQSIT